MANEVKLTLKVNDDNTLSIVSKKAKQASKDVDNLSNSSDRLNRLRSRFNKVEKGVGEMTSNTTKAFAKQAGIAGGLVPIYASIAANVFAVSSAFRVLQRAAAVEQLREGLVAVGSAAGQNLPYIADQLKEITGAAISTEQAMRATALASSAGFSTQQLADLTKVAKGASLALGRDMGDALDRLVRGTAKLEPEILDELGIMVRLDDAVRDYATANEKTVDSLTQFERRQAFLNATIEQGREKFDDIANVVDANPYDKLAASFDNLTKTILTGLNTAFGPLVGFLSEAPGALTGALLLLGRTILRQLSPALEDMADRSALMAESLAENAEKLKSQTVKDFKSIAKTINKTDFAPAGIKSAADDYKKGSRSIAQMKKDVVALQISESSRETRLVGYRKTESGRSAEFVAQKEAEKAAIVKLRQEIENLIATEQRRGTGGVGGAERAAQNAGVKADQEGTVALGLAGMTGNIKNDFAEASEKSKSLFKDIKNAGGAAGKTGAAFRAAGGSLRLFGAAATSLLGPLGMIITIGGLLAPVFAKFFEKSGTDKALDELNESFENFITVATRLNRVIGEEGAESFNAFYASANAGVGVFESIAAGAIKVIEAGAEGTNDRIKEFNQAQVTLLQERMKLERDIVEARESGAANAETRIKTLNSLISVNTKKMDDNAEAIRGMLDSLNEFTDKSRADAIAGLTLGLAKMGAVGLDEKFPKQTAALEALIEAVGTDGTLTMAEFKKRLEDLPEELKRFIAGMKGSEDALTTFNRESQTLTQKSTTQFSKLREAAKSLGKELKDAGPRGAEEIFAPGTGAKEDLERITQELGNQIGHNKVLSALEKARATKVAEEAVIMELLGETLEENEGIMITSGAIAKENTAQAKKLKEFSKENAFFMEQQLKFERAAQVARKAKLEAELRNTKLLGNSPEILLRIKSLTFDIAAINAEINDERIDLNKIEQSRIRGLQRMNKILQKQADLTISITKSTDDLARRTLQIANADLGISGVTAQDEADILERSAKARREQEEAAFKQKLIGINLEHELLKLQFELEEIRAKNTIDSLVANKSITEDEGKARKAGISTTFDNIETSAAANKNLQMQLAGLDFGIELDPNNISFKTGATGAQEVQGLDALIEGAVTKGDVENRNATLAAQEEKRLEIIKKLNTEAAIARQSGNEALALSKEQNALSKEGEVLGQRIASARMTALAEGETQEARNQKIQMLTNKLSENEQNQIQKRIALRELEVETATRLGGPIAGAFMELTTGLQNLGEQGGVLAEGSTSSFGEKIAAIREKSGALIEQLSKMGPDGPVMAATVNAAFTMGEAFSGVFDTMKNESSTTSDKIQSGIKLASAAIQSLGAIQQAKSQRAIAAIDGEIAAEKKRDGKSAQSIARIKALEKKKEQEQRKQFENQKKMQMAQVIASTASAIVQSFANAGGFPLGMGTAAAMAAIGAAQLAVISSQSFKGGGSAPSAGGGTPSKISMGKRSNVVDVSQRASGGELAYLRGARGSGTNANDFTPAFYGSKKMRAAGGAVAGYTVGEQGPELFVPSVPGEIVPNDDVAPTQPINVNFNVQAIDSSSFNDALTVQRGNIISIIREAANGSGEGFLETVDVESLKMER
ncbi:MAG: hypothetical protein CMF96_12830 [Candidatus Marinimicrobia bacterium]|nr:hypothetical protein [Candidatus Neomarinimicrobiota bacterium]